MLTRPSRRAAMVEPRSLRKRDSHTRQYCSPHAPRLHQGAWNEPEGGREDRKREFSKVDTSRCASHETISCNSDGHQYGKSISVAFFFLIRYSGLQKNNITTVSALGSPDICLRFAHCTRCECSGSLTYPPSLNTMGGPSTE